MLPFAVSILIAYFFIALYGLLSRRGLPQRLASIAPNSLTTIGIFFTFIGISYSLFNFDTNSIETSVPILLEGLKLAFVSSVVGIALSIFFRFIDVGRKPESSFHSVNASDIYKQLELINSNLAKVNTALVDSNNTSISTEIGLLRQDFTNFTEKLRDETSSSLAEALTEILSKFNEKFGGQFDENLKQLNTATASLLQWQIEYKNEIEQLISAFRETKEGIKEIVTATSSIPAHISSIQRVFAYTERRIEELCSGLTTLAEISDSAKNINS